MFLDRYPELIIATSTVADGNMSFIKGDPQEALKNRKRFLAQQGIDINSIISMSCQHGTDILRITKNDLGKGAVAQDTAPKVDGFITNESGIFLFLLTADCLPVSFFDPVNKALGLIHAGYKGLDQNILIKAAEMMKKEFQTDPQKLLAQINPSLGPCCYKPAYPENTKSRLKNYIEKYSGDEYSLNVWQYAQDQLEEAGLKSENIMNLKDCTFHNGKFYSHRKAEIEHSTEDYRFATVLGIKP